MKVLITDAQRKLATRVAKESNKVTVRFGHTNGRPCLHLRLHENKDPSTSAETIYSVQEWNLHPWNNANKPRKKRDGGDIAAEDQDIDVLDAVANREVA